MRKVDVLKYYGTRTAIAKALRISPSAITQWPDIIPEKQAYKLERITKGGLTVDINLYKKQGKQK
ncbi:MAG: Cro/CI family transcriptional regulator [Neisseria sp.]|uniref:Cro/CI family transcriptional regulator n=1 Tax=Neisseria sp. TaxID=192066 RepID=UPI0026DAB25A|nr:Cro/CI family transcriptional regulator [Neisseria sp.]MDO4641691.1 Cro/CI family transcriptional regulator [Neisseria sp.]